MNDSDLQDLMDKAMAGRLSPEEEQRWSALLAQRPELEEEIALGDALQALPKPPSVSSNFTALVMREIQRDNITDRSKPWFSWLRWPTLARITATAVVALGIALTVQHQREAQRTEVAAQTIANGVKIVAPSISTQPESVLTVLKDFEAIRRLPAPPVDENLLAALSE